MEKKTRNTILLEERIRSIAEKEITNYINSIKVHINSSECGPSGIRIEVITTVYGRELSRSSTYVEYPIK